MSSSTALPAQETGTLAWHRLLRHGCSLGQHSQGIGPRRVAPSPREPRCRWFCCCINMILFCGSQLRFFPGRGLSLICSSQGPHIATFIHDKQTNKIYREERVSQESPPTKTRINKKLESTNNRATTTPTHHSVFAPPPRHALTIQCLGSSTTATGAGGRCPER